MTSKEWKNYKFSELVYILGGGTPKTTVSEYWNGTIPWLSVKDFNSGEKFVYTTEKTITQLGLKKSSTQLLKKNDIILSARGTVGEIAVIPFLMAFNQSCYGIRAKEEIINSDFLYYLLKNSINLLKHNTHGSVFDTITRETFDNIAIKLPPLETQQKIAKILSAIDDKIELNNSINNNLEQQMDCLFLNFISNNADIEYKVKDVILTANTGADAIQKAPIVNYNTGIKCVRVGDMSNDRSIYDWGCTKITDSIFKQYQLKKDDIIITRTATLGLNKLITDDLNAVYNNGLIRISIDKNKVLPLFLYRQFQTNNFFSFINRIEAETSVRPNMKINYLLSYPFKCSNIELQKELVAILEPMLKKQVQIKSENQKLTQLRDTLLPKLMNGEIDVSKVDISADKLLFREDK